MTATEFKATALSVLDEVAAGEPVVVTKHGRPVAKVVPIRDSKNLEGMFSGIAKSAADDEDLFSTGEAWNAS